MTPERWQQVKGFLDQALQIPPEERGAFLDGACNSDQQLRAEVVSLLSEEEVVRSKFLQSPLLKDTGNNGDESREPEGALRAGLIFAERFELIRKLGEGGMGQVWLAEQTSPMRRQVALKLIKAGMYDELVVRRFQAERQSLAIMDHPAIAKVFDAGTTPQGQPYFVMEYVPGLPITEYCDQKKLKITDRLELFIQACEGVQHAHQKAIIHRDLKPANILVVEVDGKPVARIIDFGLAKATTPQAEGETMFTQMGYFVGTPGYMSPEQADSGVKDIDTRTDVYSLGAVLYVLLAGSQPFAAKSNEKLPLHELLRKLREEEPPSPSTRVSSDRETSSATAEARSTEPKQLASLLRGDLDWITMKALEKDRARRYGSPLELAADVRHYLNHEAVTARPATTSYQLRKYVRRHRIAVGVAAGLVMLLTAFSIMQAVELRRITRERDRANNERDRANRERDRATRITDFMTNMFKVSDPSEARGNSITAREILDKASNDMGNSLARDPEAQSQLLHVMAGTYLNLGLYPRAHELAKRALDTRMALLGPNDPKTLESMTQLGWILWREGRNADAEQLEQQALAGERRALQTGDSLVIDTMDHLAVTLISLGRYREAEKLAREAIDDATHKSGPESRQALQSMNALARALWYQSRYADAEQVYGRAADIDRRVLGPDHPQTLAAMLSLAVALSVQHRLTEAEPLYREVLAAQRRVLGPEHPETARTLENLAELTAIKGQLAEAEKLHREALRIQLRTLGPEHAETLLAENNLAQTLLWEGHVREAEKLQRETLTIQTRALGPENRHTLKSESTLAAILIREGRHAEAEKLAQATFAVQVRAFGPQDPDSVDTLRRIGEAMAYNNRYTEASQLFRDALAKDTDSGQGNRFQLWYAFACVATAANRAGEALQYLGEAVSRGYQDADGLMADEDLKSLHQNPKFQELVVQLRRVATNQVR